MAPASQSMWTQLGGAESVYEVDLVVFVQRFDQITDAAGTLLRLLDGRRSIQAVADALGWEQARTIAALVWLAGLRVIRPVNGLALVTPSSKPAPSFEEAPVNTWDDDPEVIQLPVFER